MENEALPFKSREDTILGTNISFETVARLGLNMHVGTEDKASKIKAVYFPSRTKILYWLKEHVKKILPSSKYSTVVFDPSKRIRKRALKQQEHIIDRYYVKVDETKKFIMNKNEYVSFCLNFLYLGSWISCDLNDECGMMRWEH